VAPWQGESIGGYVRVDQVERETATDRAAPVAVRRCGSADNVALVTLRGEFDIETVHAIDTGLRRALGPFFFRRHLVFDLHEATFVDSAFVGYLVQLVGCVRSEGCDVVLTRPRGQVRRVLLLVGLHNLTPVYDSLEGALNMALANTVPFIPPSLPKAPPADA
jgi:anti-anti-sigma factor